MLLDLTGIGIAAGREIMAVYEAGGDARSKADGSPVTEADTRAEAVILAALAQKWPDIPVVAEEEVASGRVPDKTDRLFLVDPLDGTREFVTRNGEFTVNIALIENGVPTVGMVYVPALGVLYSGSAEGAFRAEIRNNAQGEPARIGVRPAPAAIRAVGSRSHGSDEVGAWLKRFGAAGFSPSGSSLKFCLIACGEADVYPRFGRTMEWDTAAGDAVLRAAGGMVTTRDGGEFRYNKRGQAGDVDFANPHFIAYGDRALAARCKES